jgi:hypothetical protein
MQAALVGAVGQVDLQRFQLAAANRRKGQLVEQGQHCMHGFGSLMLTRKLNISSL